MKGYEKEILESGLADEEDVIAHLKKIYADALDQIDKKVELLMARDDADMMHVIYQVEYQENLRAQIDAILDMMQTEEFTTIAEYITKCYDNGFVGTMYSIANQGIPLMIPIDQTAVVKAVQLDSKISQGLYERLGEDVTYLKRRITSEVSRGISTGMSYQEVARQLALRSNIGYNNAVRISRTEGHRVTEQASYDAALKAKESGCDLVKQWDSTLDKRTRASHRKVDGEIRELEEPFSNGLMFPSDPDGAASEVINCRCALLKRAKWALDEEELETLRKRAAYFGLDKTESFKEYEQKYLKTLDNTGSASYNRGEFKNIELPSGVYDISGMTADTAEAISNAVDTIKNEYDVKLNNLVVESLGKGYEKVPFQFIPMNSGSFLDYRVAINKDYYFDDSLDTYTDRILKNFNSGVLASKSIEDLLAHEMAHVMTFQDCDKYSIFERVEEEVRDTFVKGMSTYADSTHDGAETIAEAFVRYRRHEKLPDDIMELLNRYVLRWKR